MEQPIEIVIRRLGSGDVGSGVNGGVGSSIGTPTIESVGKSSLAKGAVNTALINGGRALLSSTFRQFTQFSGNSFLQNEIDSTLEVAAMAGTILKGGWAGVATVAFQLTGKAITSQMENFKHNYEANLLYQRSGNASIDGGRGTHD